MELAREYSPEVKAELIGWWWTDTEHELFCEWAEKDAPGLFSAMNHHVLYGETSYANRLVPEGCSDRAFLNIGYGEKKGMDLYGHFGPTIAPRRLEKTLAFLFKKGADGFLAYSEGACDEINKAIAGGLASAQYETADAVLEAYAKRHLGGDIKGWRAWLCQMGDVTTVDIAAARADFTQLARSSKPGWRLQALDEKLKMYEANAAVESHASWTIARMAAAEDFWVAKENLWRGIWKMGLGRHSIHLKYDGYSPKWDKEYRLLHSGQSERELRELPDEA